MSRAAGLEEHCKRGDCTSCPSIESAAPYCLTGFRQQWTCKRGEEATVRLIACEPRDAGQADAKISIAIILALVFASWTMAVIFLLCIRTLLQPGKLRSLLRRLRRILHSWTLLSCCQTSTIERKAASRSHSACSDRRSATSVVLHAERRLVSSAGNRLGSFQRKLDQVLRFRLFETVIHVIHMILSRAQ